MSLKDLKSNPKYIKCRLFTENLGDALIPKKYRKQLQDYLRKASIYNVPYFKFGIMAYIVIIVSIILDIFLLSTHTFSNIGIIGKLALSVFLVPILSVILMFITVYAFKIYLDIRIQIKINEMKECFPEFLSALSLNLRIGGTLDVALENSTDKEFGPLSDEINIVVRNIHLGTNEYVAVKEFTDKYKIDTITDTFELLLISMRKGGNTANLAERIYENMKESRFLRDKIIASVTNYRIFLTVLALIIAPAMFALTYHLMDLIRRVSKEVSNIPNNVALPFHISVVKVNDVHFIIFATLCVLLISVAIAFIISVVKTGEAKHAYKQIIIYAILSLLMFQLCMFLFGLFFKLFAV